MKIRESLKSDLYDVLDVERQAFGEEEGPVIAKLVTDLLIDPTAMPLLSLIAVIDKRVVGHILFTKAYLESKNIEASILAPLAVVPDSQAQGVGGQLIREGLRVLSDSGVELVFVLGHPDYYPRYGFKPAGILGFEAPYPIPERISAAWMALELRPGIVGRITGKVICADTLNRPEYWRE